jgi:hypothetical protein
MAPKDEPGAGDGVGVHVPEGDVLLSDVDLAAGAADLAYLEAERGGVGELDGEAAVVEAACFRGLA